MMPYPYANLVILGTSQDEVAHWHSTMSYQVPAYVSPTVDGITVYFNMGIYHSDTRNDTVRYWVRKQGRACLSNVYHHHGDQDMYIELEAENSNELGFWFQMAHSDEPAKITKASAIGLRDNPMWQTSGVDDGPGPEIVAEVICRILRRAQSLPSLTVTLQESVTAAEEIKQHHHKIITALGYPTWLAGTDFRHLDRGLLPDSLPNLDGWRRLGLTHAEWNARYNRPDTFWKDNTL